MIVQSFINEIKYKILIIAISSLFIISKYMTEIYIQYLKLLIHI